MTLKVSVTVGRLFRAWFGVAAAAALFVSSGHAYAEASTDEKAAAEALFMHAKSLMKEGKYPEACGKFSESARLDPGIGTTLYLADCYEKAGKFASAWAEFRDAAARARLANQSDREAIARGRADKLEQKLNRVRIVLDAGADVPGLTVKRDGTVVPRPLLGTPFPLDPGDHLIEVSAPGKKSWSATVHVDAGNIATANLLVAPLKDLPPEPAPDRVAPPPLTATTEPATRPQPGEAKPDATPTTPTIPDDHPRRGRRSLRVVGYVLTGLGLGGGAAAGGLGVGALLSNNSAASNCRANNACNAAGISNRNQASGFAQATDIALAAGGATLATGLVFLVIGAPPSRDPSQAAFGVAPTAGGFVARGTF